MREALSATLLLSAARALGCSSTIVDVTEYDQSCEQAADCVAVIDGDVCCGCPNAAINKGDLANYQDSLGECSAQCDIFCEAVVVSCVDGACALGEAATLCDPGSEVFCKCVGGADGTKTCDETGQAFGACSCG